ERHRQLMPERAPVGPAPSPLFFPVLFPPARRPPANPPRASRVHRSSLFRQGGGRMAFLDLHGVSFFGLIKRTVAEFSDDEMPTFAAALAFQTLLSLFPFLLFLIALLGF